MGRDPLTRPAAHRNYNPYRYIFRNKKARARAKGIDFSLSFEEIVFPVFCPALGQPLDYTIGKGLCSPFSPSFDRIDPKKGYVSGNVIIVSNLANRIKSNATVDQLKKVAAYYEQLIPHHGASHATAATDLVQVSLD